MNWRKQVYIHI